MTFVNELKRVCSNDVLDKKEHSVLMPKYFISGSAYVRAQSDDWKRRLFSLVSQY